MIKKWPRLVAVAGNVLLLLALLWAWNNELIDQRNDIDPASNVITEGVFITIFQLVIAILIIASALAVFKLAWRPLAILDSVIGGLLVATFTLIALAGIGRVVHGGAEASSSGEIIFLRATGIALGFALLAAGVGLKAVWRDPNRLTDEPTFRRLA